jgi:hypothetical protein
MNLEAINIAKTLTIGRVEKSGLIVTSILVIVNAVIGSSELAFGTAAGGLLFTANFLAIRLVVEIIVKNSYPKGFSIFAFLLKMIILIGIVFVLFLFTNINLYGFFIGVTGVVIVIIGEGLKGSKNGSL